MSDGIYTFCAQCGPRVIIDAEGCCVTCGATACGDGVAYVEALRAEAERYKAALREITGIGPSFDAKGTQSRRIDKIARRALNGEKVVPDEKP